MKTIWLFLTVSLLIPFTATATIDCTNFSKGGYLIAAGQLDLDDLPTGVSLQIYNGVAFTAFVKLAGNWSPGRPGIRPGYGCFVSAGNSGLAACFTNSLTPVLPLPLPVGFSLVCCQTNGPATFEDIVGRAPGEGAKLFRLRPGGSPLPPIQESSETNFYVFSFDGGAWNPQAPVTDVHEAVWIYQPPTTSNLQAGSDGFSFDVQSFVGGTVTVEYSEALELTNSWSSLTNISGVGAVTHILDPTDTTTVTQRFYRLNLQR